MIFSQPIQDPYIQPVINVVQKKEEPKKEPKLYTFKENDNLTIVSEAHTSSLKRLWDKNTQLTNPDLIPVGTVITIPEADEVLADRPLPVIIEPLGLNQTTQTSAPSGRSSVSGNTYSVGYCTHFAKQMRPDLPNNLGNADTWYIRYNGPKGSEPRVGAIGVAKGYMHVVYITGVNGDTVTLSEQNYKGWGVISSRTAPASEFNYLY